MATAQHCIFCFETLVAALENRSPVSFKDVEESWASYLHADTNFAYSNKPKFLSARANISSLREAIPDAPLFVTWNTISRTASGTKLNLRGCIGTFQPSPLSEALPDYALSAALKDPRFTPISLQELSALSVSVTLLTDFENCRDPLDWVLGRHGIRVYVRAKKQDWNSCFLPDVAVQQGWNQEECVLNCMQKSGWDGTRLTWRSVDEIKVIRFQGSKESLSFDDWREWRTWMDHQQRLGSTESAANH